MKKLILIITLFFFIFPLKCFSGGPICGGPIGYGGVDMDAPGTIGKFQLDHNTETLNADRTILITDKPVQFFDANGADRNVTLPAEASSIDLVFSFCNISNGTDEDLIIRDDTPTTLITIGPGQGAKASCDGTSWKICSNGIYYDSVGNIVRVNDRLDLTDGTNTSILKHVQEPGLGGRLTFGLDEIARTMVICDVGDIDTDLGLSVAAIPSLYIFNDSSSNYTALRSSTWYSEFTAKNSWIFNAINGSILFRIDHDLSSLNAFELKSLPSKELIDTNAEQIWLYLEPKINQSGTAAYSGLKIKITETGLGDASTGDGGGTNNLILAGTSTDPDMFKVDNVGRICLAESSDPAALADHIFFYGKDVAGTGEAFAADAAANAAQLTPHNFTLFEPDITEVYPWSYYAENKALGIKINVDMAGAIRAIEGLTGKTFIYTQNIAKEVDLEKVYKDAWIENYIKAGIQESEVTKNQALETVQVDVDKWYEIEVCDDNGTCEIIRQRNKIGEKITGYDLIEDEVKPRIEIIWETEKVDKIQVKTNMYFDEIGGKFYIVTKPTKAQAITAAETEFTFNPPKWLGDRLSK